MEEIQNNQAAPEAVDTETPLDKNVSLMSPTRMVVRRFFRSKLSILGLIMVVGGAILAKPMGITGILLASVLSNLYRAIELAFFVPHNITKAAVSGTFRKILMMLLTIGISVAPFWFIKISADNYLQWAVCSVGVVAYTALVTLTIGFLFEKDDMKSVLRRISRILKR